MVKTKKRVRKQSGIGCNIGIIILIVILVCIIIGYFGYVRFFSPNIHTSAAKEQSYFYIPTGSTFSQVENQLIKSNYLIDSKSFEWMAAKMNYTHHVRPGKYLLKDRMNNRELIHMLRAGIQVPVRVIINNVRLKKDLVSQVSKQIEADSIALYELLNNDAALSGYGFNKYNVMALFIPNTYDFYWNTSVEEFMGRMRKEYKKFWNDDRIQKSKLAGLRPLEVSVLASIIEEETQKNSEKPIIAGVYINRLRKGILLQADPTIRFACGDFKIKRVLKKYKEIDSKYNTYMYPGLPPGPICIPSISSLDAVLNYQRNDFIYFCAKDDFSGYHTYARTLEQHNRNAQRYQNALNRAGILH
jgi:UPF0755 protein